MFAVTERLPMSLSDWLSPRTAPAVEFPTACVDASKHTDSRWLPSGRTALQYALRQAGVDSRDEVLLPAYTCHAADQAVSEVATPVYVDVGTGVTLDIEHAREQVSERTSAIVPTHLYGMECDMESVSAFASEHDLAVVEDAAQAVGNLLGSDTVGTESDYTICSFRFYKEMTAYGGGLLLGTGLDDQPSKQAITWKKYRMASVWLADAVLRSLPGYAYRPLREYALDPLARSSASVGEATPRSLDDWSRRVLSQQLSDVERRITVRKRNAAVYDDGLPTSIDRPSRTDTATMFRYPILVPDGKRDQLCRRLRERGIGTSTMYSYTVSPDGACPNADDAAERMLNLPVHAGLDEREVLSICEAVAEAWNAIS